MSSSLLDERHIAVNPSLIRTVGLVQAVLLQEIHFASLEDYVGGEAGQCTMGQSELADRVGIERSQAHRALKELIDAGLLVIDTCGQTAVKSYRVNRDAVETACAPARKELDERRLARRRAKGMRVSAPISPSAPISTKEGFSEDPAEPDAPLAGAEQTLFGSAEKPKRKPRQPKSAKPVDAEFEKFWEIYPRAARGSSQVGNQGDKQDARDAWDALIAAGISAATLQRRATNYADARRMAATEWSGEAPLNAAYRWLNKKHPSWDTAADDIEDERIQYWRFACQQDAKRGGTKAGEIETAFAIACQTWDEAASALGRRGARWNELLAGHDPRIREAISICWSVFKDNKPEAERTEAFRVAWLSVIGKDKPAA